MVTILVWMLKIVLFCIGDGCICLDAFALIQ